MLSREIRRTPTRDLRAASPYIERDGRFWQVVFPAAPDEGFDLCTGPHFTLWGARLSLWFSKWLGDRA